MALSPGPCAAPGAQSVSVIYRVDVAEEPDNLTSALKAAGVVALVVMSLFAIAAAGGLYSLPALLGTAAFIALLVFLAVRSMRHYDDER